MKRLIALLMAIAAWFVLAPESAQAQPSRQLPGTRPYLPGSPPINQTPLNPRTRAAASAVGVESTDFYGKKGYPKVLGDAIESQTTGGSAASGVSGANTGVSGVQASGSSGFQGNTGNQIGQNGGGTVLGGLFGGGGGGGFNAPGNGFSGGAFTGVVPKGFGFGGTPEYSRSWTAPMNGK
ncbi:MAG: hypothetical protein QM703_10525 [Gemmatales bacterium]